MLRIIIALMSTTSMQDETYNQSVKDWWGIVSTQDEGFGSSYTRADR